MHAMVDPRFGFVFPNAATRVAATAMTRGRIVAPEYQDGVEQLATGQFEISDERSPAEIAAVLRHRGLEPVWKDWDQALCSA